MIDPDELPPGARQWLDSVRGADDPAPKDRARIDAALSNRLRALGIAGSLMPQHLDAPSTGAPSASASGGVRASASGHASGGAAGAANGSAATYGGLGFSGKVALALLGAGIAATGSFFAFTHAPAGAANATTPLATRAAPAAIAEAAPPQRLGISPAAAPVPKISARTAVLLATPARAPIDSAKSRSRYARPNEPALGRPLAHTEGAPAPLAAAAAPDFLREEVALIESANDALRRRHYESALSLLDAHANRFAHGTLGEERRGLRVLALCGLGELTAGREQRDRFLRDAPHSVLAHKVEAACAAEGDTTQPAEGQLP